MVARATHAEIDAVRTNVHEAIAKFRESVIPALHEQEGYEGAYVLLSPAGKVLVLTFWTDDETARASRVSGFYREQLEKFVTIYRAPPGREAYEVVFAESPQQATAY
jgi:heme-degrading monooxygenase HmoA